MRGERPHRGFRHPQLATYLHQELQQRGWRAKDLSQRSGVAPSTISGLLAGGAADPRTLERLEGAFRDHRPHGPVTELYRKLEAFAAAPG